MSAKINFFVSEIEKGGVYAPQNVVAGRLNEIRVQNRPGINVIAIRGQTGIRQPVLAEGFGEVYFRGPGKIRPDEEIIPLILKDKGTLSQVIDKFIIGRFFHRGEEAIEKGWLQLDGEVVGIDGTKKGGAAISFWKRVHGYA